MRLLPLLLLLALPLPSEAQARPPAVEIAAREYCQNRRMGRSTENSLYMAFVYVHRLGYKEPTRASEWYKREVVSRIVQLCPNWL